MRSQLDIIESPIDIAVSIRVVVLLCNICVLIYVIFLLEGVYRPFGVVSCWGLNEGVDGFLYFLFELFREHVDIVIGL